MIWIAIVDNSMGTLFNHRRQSRDRVLVQRILEITRGHALWMDAYTAALFEPLSPGIHVDERFYERAASGEFVLAETIPPGACEKEIEKVIMTSDLGINPTNDGKTIRLLFPELTEERRKDLAKDVKKKGESAKVAIRNIRRDANDSFKKLAKEDVSEDEIKALEENAQKMTDKYIAAVDEAVEVKTKEILTV